MRNARCKADKELVTKICHYWSFLLPTKFHRGYNVSCKSILLRELWKVCINSLIKFATGKLFANRIRINTVYRDEWREREFHIVSWEEVFNKVDWSVVWLHQQWQQVMTVSCSFVVALWCKDSNCPHVQWPTASDAPQRQ